MLRLELLAEQNPGSGFMNRVDNFRLRAKVLDEQNHDLGCWAWTAKSSFTIKALADPKTVFVWGLDGWTGAED